MADERPSDAGGQSGCRARRVPARRRVSGRHRPDLRRVQPGVAGAPPRPGGRAERPVHRPRRHRLRPARLLRQPDQHAEPRRAGRRRAALQQHAHDRALLAVPLVHPDRPQPPLQRHGLHHRGLDGLPRRQRLHPVRERLALGDPAAARLQHLRHRQVAPHAGRASHRRPGPTTAGRWAAASSATTGSSAATRTSTTRSWSTTTTRSSRRRRRRRATTSPRTWSTRPSRSIADAKQVAPDKPFFMYFCTGAMHAPHHVPEGVGRQVQGRSSTTAGTPTASRSSRSRRSWASSPPNTELSRHDPDVQDWGKLLGRRAAPLRPDDGGLRRLPRAHRPPHRRADRLPQGAGRVRQHADHGDLRQRRQRRGRAERLGQRGQVLQQRARRPRAEPGGDRRHRRPEVLQPLPVGLDPRRQHAVPALEARDLPRRHLRPLHRPLAQGHQGQGRDPQPVRPRDRHGADRAGRAGHRAADADPRRHPVAAAGRQLRARPSTTPRRRPSTSPSTSR